ncbi:TetR/AcrR family transcriptional regulator [Propioniciclava coleopterorum]|uniref:TetR/AcrR family transcriptional regulator n=1 Tax=Propioniciclava coleopterorum TaxID=2714937 RepID=A0A6G7Y7Q7_9ACTN|nr:TetR/AcrR family transcriptional regulator [Propioniciclava coleopterorum]QIK72647.1 TetR/AcrR family transcriptional regulator [Propioniciclava coleopterorum]
MARLNTYPDDLRDRLIAAAYERLQQESPEQMSLRELAASVDTSTNAIYSIFGGKDALIKEVTRVARASFVAAQEPPADPTGDAVETFARGLRAYRDWARSHPSLYRLVFAGHPEQGAVTSLADETLQPLRDMIARLEGAGLLRDGTEEGRLMLVWAALHGHALLELSLWPSTTAADDLYEEHEQVLLRGLITDAALEAA